MGPRRMPYVGDQHHLQLVPGNDLEPGIEWWRRIPQAQRVISKSRARKDRAQLKKNSIPLCPSLFTSLHLRIVCGRTRVDKLGRLRN